MGEIGKFSSKKPSKAEKKDVKKAIFDVVQHKMDTYLKGIVIGIKFGFKLYTMKPKFFSIIVFLDKDKGLGCTSLEGDSPDDIARQVSEKFEEILGFYLYELIDNSYVLDTINNLPEDILKEIKLSSIIIPG